MTVVSTYFRDMWASIRPVRHLLSDRLWEVDMLRGIAVVMMVTYHVMFDLRVFGGHDIDIYGGFWRYWQQITASLFIGIVGLSLTLSYQIAKQKSASKNLWPKYLRRGFEIFSWGLVVSFVTFLFDAAHYIQFGILHMIGLSIMIAYPLLRFRWLNLFLGVALILAAEAVPWLGFDFEWLNWLGLDRTPHIGFDFFPMIPWFGVVLIGIFLGNIFYPQGQRTFRLPDLANTIPFRPLRLLGQNSLLIYLLQQPVIIPVLIILGLIQIW